VRKTPSTIRRRLSTICGFYRYCSQERPIERDPSAHVRRPKQDYESTTLDLDRNKLGAFLVQAGLCGRRDHAPACLLACLLALNRQRISEALGADMKKLDVNRGHRTLFIHRQGNKTATIALSPRTARALDHYIGERETGPIFLNHDNTHRLDRHASARIVRRLPKAAGIAGRQPLNRRNRRQAIILIAHHTARIVKPVLEGVLSPFWSSISGASTPGLKCGVGRPMVV
jgi:integrase/recombinase XerD